MVVCRNEQRTATISGGRSVITWTVLAASFVACLAIFYRWISRSTGSSTPTSLLQENQIATRCSPPSIGTTEGNAYVDPRSDQPESGDESDDGEVPELEDEVEEDEENAIICAKCETVVHYSPANTVIFYFQDAPWYTVAQTICENCNAQQSLFIWKNLSWELRWAAAHDLGFVMIEGAPEKYTHVYEAFHEYYEGYPRFRELTEWQEKECLFLAWLLNHYDSAFFSDDEGGTL